MGKSNSSSSSGSSGTPSGVTFGRLLSIILAVLVIIVLLQNARMVNIKFLFWDVTMSLALLFPLILLIGLIIGIMTQILLTRKK